MKIEKVNENQIRCTLTREDLAERQIKLSELAYGTEKAKMLFRDMMQQAAYEFGFEADDIPLMIEAIPLSADTIILVITKVEYPEELDTRFSRFSDPDPEDLYEDAMSGSVQNAAAACGRRFSFSAVPRPLCHSAVKLPVGFSAHHGRDQRPSTSIPAVRRAEVRWRGRGSRARTRRCPWPLGRRR